MTRIRQRPYQGTRFDKSAGWPGWPLGGAQLFHQRGGQVPVDAVVKREFRMVITMPQTAETLRTVLFSAPRD